LPAKFIIGLICSFTIALPSFSDNDIKISNDNETIENSDNDITNPLPAYQDEISIELEKLKKIREEVEKKIEEDKKILQKIKEEREKLKKEREDFERYIKQVESERYKKLAKVFEKMEPELAGEKISKMKNPKTAAYIIYNMKERKAGEVMNYVDPKMVNKILKILTQLKKSN